MKIGKLASILSKAFLDTISSTLGRFLFGSFGSIAAILFFWKNLRDYQNGVFFWMCLVFVGILLLVLLYRFVKFSFERVREYYRGLIIESLYGDAIIHLKYAFSYVHHLRKTSNVTDKEIGEAMLVVCDSIKTIFDSKTKSPCAVSIKLPLSGAISTSSETQTQFTEVIRTICRDTASQSRNTETQKAIRHTIVGNTPYLKILLLAGSSSNSRPFFYSNHDIRNSRDYESTSRAGYTNQCLPYNSQLVIPIMPIMPTESEQNKIAGFLVIDSNSNYTFGDKYDIGILEGVADGLYDVIMRLNDLILNK